MVLVCVRGELCFVMFVVCVIVVGLWLYFVTGET